MDQVPPNDGLAQRLSARGFLPPDYHGRGLVNVPATVLDLLGARDESDPPALTDLRPALRDGVRQVVVILVDGLGYAQLERVTASGDAPFLAALLERARRDDGAQLLALTSVFPSTTAAAITTMNTARTPQEHGNLAYFLWLAEFGRVTQMLRWGRADQRRGSYFDDPRVDPRSFVNVPSIHGRLRARGARSYVVEPEQFRTGALERMYVAEAEFVGYPIPSAMGVRLRDLLEQRPWGEAPAYVYAYWEGLDYVVHRAGPGGTEESAEAAAFDLCLKRAIGDRPPGDTLVLLTADHGHAAVDPETFIDLHDDAALLAMLRHPLSGEPRVAFFHTDRKEEVATHLELLHPGVFTMFSRDDALAAGLFGRGDPELVTRRAGDLLGLVDRAQGLSAVRIEGRALRQRGSHGGMTPAEMRIPLLAWRA